MKGKSYVINLKRRPDRLERFTKFYADNGPNLELEIFEAIDGTIQEEFNKVPESIKCLIFPENDFKNAPKIMATAFSHFMIWDKIANDLDNDYALIYEDDCYFRPINKLLPDISGKNLKQSWKHILDSYHFQESSILYFGVGDLLPIHTCPPSESILIAQEKCHVTDYSGKPFGKPNFRSPYVFSWLGCSSYVISKETAKYLLDLAKTEPINRAIDAWIVNNTKINKYFTVPLFTYTPNILDSDTATKPS